ncbi:MAG: tetratricopeptide repeat protein [Acidobacteria bacterium]|nr:tetratricopeptide repeat protein [Acidobacteriota bacterium]
MNQRIIRILAGSLMAASLTLAQNAGPAKTQPQPDAPPVTKQPQIKSQKEAEAFQAILQAADPDARIKAVDDFLVNFADTELKAFALTAAAEAAQQKNDFEKMILYAERAIEADPEGYAAMLIVATGIPQRTREFDLDKDEKLAKAEKLANRARELAQNAAKPNAQVPDEQWEQVKKLYVAQSHEALGHVAMARKKYDAAVQAFKTAVEIAPQPDQVVMARLVNAYNLNGKPDDAIATADKVLALPNLHPTVKQIVETEKNNALRAKGGAAKPAAPAAAPAQPGTPAPSPAPPKTP